MRYDYFIRPTWKSKLYVELFFLWRLKRLYETTAGIMFPTTKRTTVMALRLSYIKPVDIGHLIDFFRYSQKISNKYFYILKSVSWSLLFFCLSVEKNNQENKLCDMSKNQNVLFFQKSCLVFFSKITTV